MGKYQFYNTVIRYSMPNIEVDDFALKHFGKGQSSTFLEMDDMAFMTLFLKYTENSSVGLCAQVEGMPFCRYIRMGNFTPARESIVEITNENYIYLRSAYERRSKEELPVLSRWIELPRKPEVAKYLFLILYSAEQLKSEALAKDPLAPVDKYQDGKWFIISIIATSTYEMPPMPPITMMRNALGKEEGGNGVPLDREEYEEAVKFWENHAHIR